MDRTEKRLLTWALLMGAVLWTIHALIHWLFLHGGNFLDILIRRVPQREVAVRCAGVLVIFCLALVTAVYHRRRRRIVRELELSESMFRSIFDRNPLGMAIVDTETQRFLRINSSLESILGYSAAELEDLTVAQVTHPEDWESEARKIQAYLESGKSGYTYRKRYLRKDGGIRHVNVSGEIMPHRRPGEKRLALAMIEDITDSIEILERLRESEERFRTMAETVPLGIQEIDREGRIRWVNPAYCRMFRCEPEDVVGSIIWEHLPDQSSLLDLKEYYARLMRDEPEPEVWSGRNVVAEGEIIDVRIYWDYRRDIHGRVTGTIAVITDVTREIRQGIQLFQARRMEAVGRLAGGVAHDLNNLLTPILGYAEVLQTGGDLEETVRREALDGISHAGGRARDLVRQLLAFGRRQTMEFRTLDMNSVIQGMELLMRRTIRENVAIHYRLAAEPLMVRADPAQLEQVLTNLAVNAQDAMPEGGKLTIETSRVILDGGYIRSHPMVNPGDYAMLAVTDTGCGMDQETRDRVFDPFFTTKESGHGTGLGLATIYGIVKQHGGYIWVYSEPGRGSTFKLYLPLGRDDRVPGYPRRREGGNRDVPGGTEQVLVTEDDPMVLRLAKGMLQRLGYGVAAAASGEECLALFDTPDPPRVDLLLTDVVMPGMNGKELYGRLKQQVPGLRVVYMSGYTDNVIAHHGVIEKGIAFLQKPFTLQSLAQRVRQALDEPAPPGGDENN